MEMADSILNEFETHRMIIDAGVKIDFLFAYGKRNEDDELVGNALTLHGCRALGICRKTSLKDRAMGRGDAEISLDHDWWQDAPEDQRRALLDHELHHIEVKLDEGGVCKDDLQRPVIRLRKHDVEVGWFREIAARHGSASQERIQAKATADQSGQYFWPEIFGTALESDVAERSVTIKGAGASIRIDSSTNFRKLEGFLQDGMQNAIKAEFKGAKDTSVPMRREELDEDLVQNCIEVIREEGKASVSLLQRRLRLGYTNASTIMDELESRGIVGPSKGAEPRDILIDLAKPVPA